MSLTPSALIERLRGLIGVIWREVIKFGIVGAFAMVVDMGSFNLLLRGPFSDFPQGSFVSESVASTIVSTALATAFAWVGNRLWTFRHRRSRPAHHEFLLFAGTNGVALVISALCLAFTNKVLMLEGDIAAANIAKVVGIVLGTLFRFWAYRQFVFVKELVAEEAAEAPESSAV